MNKDQIADQIILYSNPHASIVRLLTALEEVKTATDCEHGDKGHLIVVVRKAAREANEIACKALDEQEEGR